MADFLFTAVSHGDAALVRDILAGKHASAPFFSSSPSSSTTDKDGKSLREWGNMFAADGALFERAVRRGDAAILRALMDHFNRHFRESAADTTAPDSTHDNDDGDDEDFQDMDAPLHPTSLLEMRRSFDTVLRDWPTTISKSSSEFKLIIAECDDFFSASGAGTTDEDDSGSSRFAFMPKEAMCRMSCFMMLTNSSAIDVDLPTFVCTVPWRVGQSSDFELSARVRSEVKKWASRLLGIRVKLGEEVHEKCVAKLKSVLSSYSLPLYSEASAALLINGDDKEAALMAWLGSDLSHTEK